MEEEKESFWVSIVDLVVAILETVKELPNLLQRIKWIFWESAGSYTDPAWIAVFSTDDPSTPAIVPFLIFVGGYGVEIGWFVLLFFAVRIIVRSFKKEEQDKIPV